MKTISTHSVACPYCGAPPNQPCHVPDRDRSPFGPIEQPVCEPHRQRLELALEAK